MTWRNLAIRFLSGSGAGNPRTTQKAAQSLFPDYEYARPGLTHSSSRVTRKKEERIDANNAPPLHGAILSVLRIRQDRRPCNREFL
jgi:hypothetical protein